MLLAISFLTSPALAIQCQPNCEKCFLSKTQVICQQCQKHYAMLKNACIRCTDPLCETCLSTDTSHCLSCQNKYFVRVDPLTGINSCKKCIDGCVVCEDVFSCDQCQFGYTNTSQGTCTFDFIFVTISASFISSTIILFFFCLYKLIDSCKKKWKDKKDKRLQRIKEYEKQQRRAQSESSRILNQGQSGNRRSNSSSGSSESSEEEKSHSDSSNNGRFRKSIPMNRTFKEDEVTPKKLFQKKPPLHQNSLIDTSRARKNLREMDTLTTKSRDQKANSKVQSDFMRKLSSFPSGSGREEKIEEIKSDDEMKEKSKEFDKKNQEENESQLQQEHNSGELYDIRKKSKAQRRASHQN